MLNIVQAWIFHQQLPYSGRFIDNAPSVKDGVVLYFNKEDACRVGMFFI